MANRIDVTKDSMTTCSWLRNALRLLVCLAFGSAISACNAFGEQKLEGTVWDRATWKPIEGVMVVARYSKLADGFVVTNFASFCHKSAMVMTGPDGKFEFPRDWKCGLPDVVAFKPMYVVSSMPHECPPGTRKTVPVLRDARETDPVLKLNPYKSAMDYPDFKEPERVAESSRRGSYRQDYAGGARQTLVDSPFSSCGSTRIVATRKERQAWIDLFKAELKEMERLDYPKVMIDGKKRGDSVSRERPRSKELNLKITKAKEVPGADASSSYFHADVYW
jgi:hypothetical protein